MNLLTKDVVIRLFRAARQRRTESPTNERRIQIFDAVVYTSLPLQLNPVPDRFPYSVELASLPAAGVEQITIETADYESDLASFIEGEQSMQCMRDRLLQMMSSNLRTLLTNPQSDIRIWWSSSTPSSKISPGNSRLARVALIQSCGVSERHTSGDSHPCHPSRGRAAAGHRG